MAKITDIADKENNTGGVYLDYQASTPVDPRVIAAMLPMFSETYANPHSVQHAPGRTAAAAVETARGQAADLIGARAREIIFTSGATEANNLAIKGAMRFALTHGRGRHMVTAASEHKCVLEAAADMAKDGAGDGATLTILPVSADGLIDVARLEASLTDDTALVSIMTVNNETGTIQPVAEIGALCRARGILFHTDAAQAAGKVPMDVEAMGIDLLSFTAHKMYGPKGIGALYVRRRPRARLTPLFSGGGQERGLRSGTLPVPLCVGFGVACAISAQEMERETARLRVLRGRLRDALEARLDGIILNGTWDQRIAANLNVQIDGVDGAILLAALDDVAISTGSACNSASQAPSYVLTAMGLSDAQANQSFRMSVGRFTTEDEIDFAAARLSEMATEIRGGRIHGGRQDRKAAGD